MQTLINMFELMGNHPFLTLLFSLVVAVMVAVIIQEVRARKKPIPVQITPEVKGAAFMQLKAIHLYSKTSVDIQVIAFVNGMEFHYPSSDRDKWVSTSMKVHEIIIELPKAELYRIHLAIHVRSGETFEGGPMVIRRAQLKPPPIPHTKLGQLPLNLQGERVLEDYKLYYLEDGLRDTRVKAIIPCEFYMR